MLRGPAGPCLRHFPTWLPPGINVICLTSPVPAQIAMVAEGTRIRRRHGHEQRWQRLDDARDAGSMLAGRRPLLTNNVSDLIAVDPAVGGRESPGPWLDFLVGPKYARGYIFDSSLRVGTSGSSRLQSGRRGFHGTPGMASQSPAQSWRPTPATPRRRSPVPDTAAHTAGDSSPAGRTERRGCPARRPCPCATR